MFLVKLSILSVIILNFCAGFAYSQNNIAVIKLTYSNFSEAEKAAVDAAFYTDLKKELKIDVMPASDAQKKLISLGYGVERLVDETAYIQAGQILNVDHTLVGTISKIGTYVDVTIQVFNIPKGIHNRYSMGETKDSFIEQAIPLIVKEVEQMLGLGVEPEKKGRSRKLWFAIGGVAVISSTAALVLGSGGSDGRRELPAPPVVP